MCLNDLTDSFFGHRKFPIEEMFYMIRGMRSVPTARIASDLDRNYETVLNFPSRSPRTVR